MALGVAGSSTDGRARLVSTAAARAASALGLPAAGAAGVSWEELRAKQRAVLAATAARRSKTKDCPARKEQEEPELEERMARLAITDRVPLGGRSNETVPQPPESPEQGKVLKFLDSISTHDEAFKRIDRRRKRRCSSRSRTTGRTSRMHCFALRQKAWR